MCAVVEDLVCPGCGGPVGIDTKKCEYCHRDIVVRTFNTFSGMNPTQMNKYQQTYRKMLAADPHNAQIKSAMAMTLLKLGLYDQAIKMFDDAALDDLDNADTFMYAAVARLQGKRPLLIKRPELDKAIENINAAIMIEPKGIQYYLLGVIKFDYFGRKGFKSSPDYKECFSQAKEFGVTDEDIMMLDEILKFDSKNLPPF